MRITARTIILACLATWSTSLGAGCWLTHDTGGHPGSGGDADADADADADGDSDADGDGDADPGDPGHPVRPQVICGLPDLSRPSGGTLRLRTVGCTPPSCDVTIEGGMVDLRPRAPEVDCDSETPIWFDCVVPAGDYSSLAVWGEPMPTECFGGDMGDCAAGPECVELPPERVPDGCDVAPLLATGICGPEVAGADYPVGISITNDCSCTAERVPAGCWLDETDDGFVVRPLMAQCGGCGPEAVCVRVEASCSLFDLELGTTTVTPGVAACREPPVLVLPVVPGSSGSDEPNCADCS